jgi:hypothetical protein
VKEQTLEIDFVLCFLAANFNLISFSARKSSDGHSEKNQIPGHEHPGISSISHSYWQSRVFVVFLPVVDVMQFKGNQPAVAVARF